MVVEHYCIELAAKLEMGMHLLEVLKPQGPSIGSGTEKIKRAFEHFEQGKNRCSL